MIRSLKAEVIFKGLKIPTSMAFLGPNDILVLEKNSGNVLRIVDGSLIKKPLLHVNVPTQFLEWGLLGIAISKQAILLVNRAVKGIPMFFSITLNPPQIHESQRVIIFTDMN